MKILIKIILFLILVIIVTPILLSKYFFSGKPRDLGVTYTQADYTQSHDKIETQVTSVPLSESVSAADTLQFSGRKDVDISLNSSEITAYINSDKYIYAPLSQVQIKINPDGTGEASGIINLKNFLTYISLTTPVNEVQKAIDKFHISSNPPFYAQGTLRVIDNQVSFDIQKLEVGHILVPQGSVSENLGALNDYASKRLNSIPNLQVRSLTLSNSQVNLDATVPEIVKKVEK